MNFQQKLEHLLISNQITKYRLAKDIGVSQSTIDNWIKGKSKPHFNYIKLISDYFEVTQECLLDDNVDGLIYVVKGKDKGQYEVTTNIKLTGHIATDIEQKALSVFQQLNEDNQDIIMGKMKELLKEQKYESVAADTNFKEAK